LQPGRDPASLPCMPLSADTCWIDDPDHLRRRLSEVATRVGLDTEFIRERTFWPQLAVVQIAFARADGALQIILADAQRPGMCEALRPLLAEPSILKIMHSASEDLVALHHACGVLPAPLFDTQIAAGLAGIGAGLGYQRLLGDLLGVLIDKGQTRSDWSRRPLSEAQLRYAAEDVCHLFALHDALSERLHLLQRMVWLEEDCARQLSQYSDAGERWPHLALRGAQALEPDAQLRLLRLLRWRDAYARERDRPRNWIVDNALALQLAAAPPGEVSALQRELGAHPKAPRKLDTAIWKALNTPLADEAELPLAHPEEFDKQALQRLQRAVAVRSAELGLPDGVLAPRRGLVALLEQGRWPDMLSGWRRAELEAVLTPLGLTQKSSGASPDLLLLSPSHAG